MEIVDIVLIYFGFGIGVSFFGPFVIDEQELEESSFFNLIQMLTLIVIYWPILLFYYFKDRSDD